MPTMCKAQPLEGQRTGTVGPPEKWQVKARAFKSAEDAGVVPLCI
jgi:hypothetical protein